MRLNEERIKAKVKRAIEIKPTHIVLNRFDKTSNGMRGEKTKEVVIGEFDAFIDDSKHNYIVESIRESGTIKRTRGITMIAVIEAFELFEGDFFLLDGIKYRVTYPGEVVKDVYIADIEAVK